MDRHSSIVEIVTLRPSVATKPVEEVRYAPAGAVSVLEVNRASLGDIRLVDDAPVPLGDHEVRLRIDRFAITANNTTYGVFGDILGYWDFFP